jgi:transglutaminase-like putative cysteine protease
VYLPDVGWHDFDPTNNRVPLDRHVTTAWGRDYNDVTPLKGVIFGGDPGQQPRVSVDMERLPEPGTAQ